MDCLTARQLQVLELACQDRSNGEIAYALGIRPQTVKMHLALVYARLGMQGRAGARRLFGADRRSHADTIRLVETLPGMRAEQI
jgi:DNA-binding CsgD family transcriptional regulator